MRPASAARYAGLPVRLPTSQGCADLPWARRLRPLRGFAINAVGREAHSSIGLNVEPRETNDADLILWFVWVEMIATISTCWAVISPDYSP